MHKTLDQSAYDTFFRILEKEATVYPINPPEETPYPFIQAGQIQIIPNPTKTKGLASVFYNFDVWGSGLDRSKISGIAARAMQALTNTNRTPEGFRLVAIKGSSSVVIAPDNSTNEELWRASCSLEYRAY